MNTSRDLHIRQHRIRLVLRRDGHGGIFGPNILVFLNGPNGSPAGFGPKGWPRIFRPLFPRYNGRRDRWSNTLWLTVPHLPWRYAYRLRHVGGLHLYRLQNRLWLLVRQ